MAEWSFDRRPATEGASKMTIGRYLLLGAGDLAREVARILMRNAEFSRSISEIAVVGDIPDRVSPEFDRFCVTPGDALREYPPSDWQAIVCVGDPKLREKLYTQFRELGYGFATACDRDATIF